MQNDVTPVAARNKARVDGTKVQSDANLHVQVDPPTKRFHSWQQAPAWLSASRRSASASYGAAELRLLGRVVRGVDRRDPLGGRLLPLGVCDRRDRDQHVAGQEGGEEGDAAARRAVGRRGFRTTQAPE